MSGTLQIGILVSELNIHIWEFRVLKKIALRGAADIKLVIMDDDGPETHGRGKYPFFYRFHEKLDRSMFRDRFDYDVKTDMSALTGEAPLVRGIEEALRHGSWQDLDLILNFGVELAESAYTNVPPFGIWSYRVGDKRMARDETAAYLETVKNLPEMEGTVYMHKSGGTGTVICRTWTPTYPESINFVREQVYAAASVVVPRLIAGLASGGVDYLEKQINRFKRDDEPDPAGAFSVPSSFQALGNLFTVIRKKIGRKIFFLNPDLWYIITSGDRHQFPLKLDPGKFTDLKPPAGKFWADPFIVSKENKHYIFIEEYLYATGKGHISVLELDDRGALVGSDIILDKPYHMSYPFIFELDDRYYMIPETMENRTIELYRCRRFPGEWEFVMNLMEDINAVDSTLFFHEKKWWLFTSIDETESWLKPFTELFLFFTDDLFSGEWKSHPGNPVVTDLKASRQAGNIFRHEGRIYRPAQDCSRRYGRAMKIREITRLDEQQYEETQVLDIEPEWHKNVIGTHTINFNENVIVLDATQRARRIKFKLF